MHSSPPAHGEPHARAALRRSLAGVRALVLDADGVLMMKGAALPGAPEAIASLRARGIPFRIATNFSSAHRSTLAGRFRAGGIPVTDDRIVTAASAAAARTRAAYPGRPLYVIATRDGRREFDGQHLMRYEEADVPDARAAAVVIGDGGADLSFENLDRAFRLIRNGADLLAMHRNRWWFTARGPTIDGGAFVAALEYAAEVRAILCGKPGPIMLRTPLAGLAADLGGRLAAGDVAMVGDDPVQDIAGARRLGMRGVLVVTGKTSAAEAAALVDAPTRGAGMRRSGAVPDAVAPSLADVVAALD
jgi:HAD superfamily hydrolase (TIGR01458 family)